MCLYEAVAFLAHYLVFRMRNWSKRGSADSGSSRRKNKKIRIIFVCLINLYYLCTLKLYNTIII